MKFQCNESGKVYKNACMMKALGKWDMLFRKGVLKLPMSHLFYVLGEKL